MLPRYVILLSACAVMAPASALAQELSSSSDMVVSGAIGVSVSGTGVRPLAFGTVSPGAATVVFPLATNSAKWRFANVPNNSGVNNRYADLNFISLPSALEGPSGALLPIGSYQVRVALEKNGTDYYMYPTTWSVSPANPSLDPNPRINGNTADSPPDAPGGNAGRALVVYMGATVTPSVGQRTGTYVGTLTLTFATSAT